MELVPAIAGLCARAKPALRWVGIALDLLLFFRKHGRQFCSALFFPWRFYSNLPMTGHWRYFWSSVALPSVLFFVQTNYEGLDPLFSGSAAKLIRPMLNALLGGFFLQFTAMLTAVLYLVFSLIAGAFALKRYLPDIVSSRQVVPDERGRLHGKALCASFVWAGLREYGKAVLYSSATVAMLFCCVLVAEHNLLIPREAESTSSKSIIAQWHEISPLLGEEHAAKARGIEVDRSRNSDEDGFLDLQPFQERLWLYSLLIAAFYVGLAMGTSYWSWLSTASTRCPKEGSGGTRHELPG